MAFAAASLPQKNGGVRAFDFQKELQSLLDHFQMYEDKSNQAAALVQVPSEYLMAIAQARYDSSSESVKELNTTIDAANVVRDMFLLEVMNWFKNEFFTWMDSPKCPRCSQPTTYIAGGTPTPEEYSRSAARVESFTCRSCFQDNRQVARFPRYNHPAILLETRKGRCGEWANCFALICRALGFETRYVRDWTDHVWVEVFSCGLKPNRWVHADPCENSYDNPLLYTTGWGKKLSYVIAVSQDDIQDVTWRYVADKNLPEVLSRRSLCDETQLVETILQLRQRKQAYLPESRKSILSVRLIHELGEFLFPRSTKIKDSEMVGRESGSLAWRLARSEIGTDGDGPPAEGFQWDITGDSICDSKFSISYDCVKDQYAVLKKNLDYKIKKGWKNGIFDAKNIFRKEEQDWKMVYLARTEQSNDEKAKISWRFKVVEPDYIISAMKISAATTIYHSSAYISITISNDVGAAVSLLDSNKAEGLFTWDSEESDSQNICRSKILTLTCELRGGDGQNAWQHAQLCRQSMSNNVFNDLMPKGLSITLNLQKEL